jgi:hypothetical protein
LLNGWFIVPQNPVRDGGTALVPSVQATAPGRVLRKPHMGDFLPATFTVPQNPIVDNLRTNMRGLAGGMGCGCGTPDCGQGNYAGLSGFDVSSLTDWAQQPSPISSVPNWALYGGAAVAAYLIFMPGGSEYRAKSRALASQYRGYRRAGRSLAA